MSITKELLLKDGWEETNDPVFPLKKNLTDKECDDYDPEGGEIELVYHCMYNVWGFGLSLPDGGRIDLVVDNMEELKVIEKSIANYDPSF